MSDGALRQAQDERVRRSAASRKGARVRKTRAALHPDDPPRDDEWGPEGRRRGGAAVDGVTSVAEILDRLKAAKPKAAKACST